MCLVWIVPIGPRVESRELELLLPLYHCVQLESKAGRGHLSGMTETRGLGDVH